MNTPARHADPLEALARQLDAAQRTATPIDQPTPGALTLADGYEVQRHWLALRRAHGERQVGLKMAFTNAENMRKLGVSDMAWGHLTDAMQVADGGRIDLSRCLRPRVEPEVAFLLKHPLSGLVDRAQALRAVDAVMPALEIIDARYRDFTFSLPDVVADNVSGCGFVLGPMQRPNVDCRDLRLTLSFDGEPVATGSTAAILGDPVESLVAAARLVAAAGLVLPAGSIVMAGSATAPFALRAGAEVRVDVQALGRASFSVRASG